jgi:hypothetical protein
MEKSSQIAWKSVPLRHFFPLEVVPLIEVLLYWNKLRGNPAQSLIMRRAAAADCLGRATALYWNA